MYLQSVLLTEVLAQNLESVSVESLPTAPRARVKCREHASLYIVYVTEKVHLPLPLLFSAQMFGIKFSKM